jgi:hypothetical protein
MLICKCCLPYSSRDTQIFHSQILVIAKIALLLGHVQRNQRRKKKYTVCQGHGPQIA